jgi:hypothetical protein
VAKAKETTLTQDALVEALLPDPSGPPLDAIVIQGYLGKSPDPQIWRLYLGPLLDRYVELPQDKILHLMRFSDDRGTMVWLPRELTVTINHAQRDQVQAGFLDGAIAARQLAAPVMNPFLTGPLQATFYVTLPPAACQSHLVACPTPGGTSLMTK